MGSAECAGGPREQRLPGLGLEIEPIPTVVSLLKWVSRPYLPARRYERGLERTPHLAPFAVCPSALALATAVLSSKPERRNGHPSEPGPERQDKFHFLFS